MDDSAFTPFFRRFTDEKARDLADTKRLYARVKQAHISSRFGRADALERFGSEIFERYGKYVPLELASAFAKCADAILMLETPMFQLPEESFRHLSLKQAVDLRHFLRAKEHFHAHEDQVATLLSDCLYVMLSSIGEELPDADAPSPFTIPLVFCIPDTRASITKIIGECWKQQYSDAGLFTQIARTLWLNVCEASGIANPDDPRKPLKVPSKDDASLQVIVERYFGGTPFRDLLMTPVPLR